MAKDTVNENDVNFGGCGANVAVGLQQLGHHCGVAMVLGDDKGGQSYYDYLKEQGVDCRNTFLLPGHKTSQSYLFRNDDGEYLNFFYSGAADAWNAELQLDGLDEIRWGLVTVAPATYNISFARLLGEHGIPLAWQLKPDIAAYPPEALTYFVSITQIMFCNQLEANYLCRLLGLTDVREVFKRGVKVLVLTLGKQGAQIITPSETHNIPVVSSKVVDTTGAGDAFTAAFLAGYFREYDLLTCGRLAATMASFTIEKIGCQTNLPDWKQLCDRYENHYDKIL
ncbi:MAG: PfkB family carbohydrate kinase [Anaerolineae bacterium]